MNEISKQTNHEDAPTQTPLRNASSLTFAQPVDHAVAGSLSSMVVFAALYPLDVARTRQQVSGSQVPTGVLESLQLIYQDEGIQGLYAGITANLISIGTSQCLYFFFYELIKDTIESARPKQGGKTSLTQDLLVAFIAGTINAAVTCPMWVAATRLKLAKSNTAVPTTPGTATSGGSSSSSSNSNSNTTPTFARALVEVVGSGDAWMGLFPSLILCTNPALQYGIYEQLKGRVLRRWARRAPGRSVGVILNPVPAFIIGAIAKAIATFFTYPLQLVQTRTREKGFQGGMWEAGCALVQQARWSIPLYFRGMHSKLIMTVLNASLMFMLKESVLLSVLKFKILLGRGAYRLLRWSAFVFTALKVATALSQARVDVAVEKDPSK